MGADGVALQRLPYGNFHSAVRGGGGGADYPARSFGPASTGGSKASSARCSAGAAEYLLTLLFG